MFNCKKFPKLHIRPPSLILLMKYPRICEYFPAKAEKWEIRIIIIIIIIMHGQYIRSLDRRGISEEDTFLLVAGGGGGRCESRNREWNNSLRSGIKNLISCSKVATIKQQMQIASIIWWCNGLYYISMPNIGKRTVHKETLYSMYQSQ
jgi:hypothetical protein